MHNNISNHVHRLIMYTSSHLTLRSPLQEANATDAAQRAVHILYDTYISLREERIRSLLLVGRCAIWDISVLLFQGGCDCEYLSASCQSASLIRRFSLLTVYFFHCNVTSGYTRSGVLGYSIKYSIEYPSRKLLDSGSPVLLQRSRAYYVGEMEANCLHLEPGGNFPIPPPRWRNHRN